MSSSVNDHYEVRSWHGFRQEIEVAEGRRQAVPLVKAAVAAIIANPFAGRPYEADLSALVRHSDTLGLELGKRAVALLGGRPVESYGKGGIAGLRGAQEHVVACITTVFGDAFREAVGGGRAWISSVSKVAGAGASIDIPLAFKDEIYVRAYYDGVTLTVPESPRDDELLICVGVASGPRANHRLGGLSKEEALAKLG